LQEDLVLQFKLMNKAITAVSYTPGREGVAMAVGFERVPALNLLLCAVRVSEDSIKTIKLYDKFLTTVRSLQGP
jgi:hypothetical protein